MGDELPMLRLPGVLYQIGGAFASGVIGVDGLRGGF